MPPCIEQQDFWWFFYPLIYPGLTVEYRLFFLDFVCFFVLRQGLANHPAAHALTGAMKALGMHDTGRLLKRVLAELDKELDKLDVARAAVISAGVRRFRCLASR